MTTMTEPHATERVTFHWDDPLRLDLQLTDVEKEVQQKAFEYAQEFLLPRVVKDVGWKSRDFKVVTRRFRISKKFIAFAKQNWRNHTTISFARSLSLAKFTKERRPQARLPTTTTSDFGSL
jgi:hypothetical protein